MKKIKRMNYFYSFSSMNCELFLLDCEDKIKFQKKFENICICKIITKSQLKEVKLARVSVIGFASIFPLFQVNQNCS